MNMPYQKLRVVAFRTTRQIQFEAAQPEKDHFFHPLSVPGVEPGSLQMESWQECYHYTTRTKARLPIHNVLHAFAKGNALHPVNSSHPLVQTSRKGLQLPGISNGMTSRKGLQLPGISNGINDPIQQLKTSIHGDNMHHC